MNKIALITVFFGETPDYFRLYLESLKNNLDIDFYIIGSIKKTKSSKNVHFVNMSFDEFIDKANTTLKLKLSYENPYKTCDLKPAFGKIFHSITSNYDYWGHTDIDLYFGSLKEMISEISKNNPDIYTPGVRSTGHLQVYKSNNIFLKKLLKTAQYNILIHSKNNHILDEFFIDYFALKYKEKLKWSILDIDDIKLHLTSFKGGATNFPDNERIKCVNLSEKLTFTNTKNITKSILYYHWMGQKKTIDWNSINSKIIIENEKSIQKNQHYIFKFIYILCQKYQLKALIKIIFKLIDKSNILIILFKKRPHLLQRFILIYNCLHLTSYYTSFILPPKK